MIETLLVVAATSSGLVGGLFFAFSNFVMKALARLPGAQGMAAMQHINKTVLNPLFYPVFLGTGAVALVLAAASLGSWEDPGAVPRFAGAVLYLAARSASPSVCNVPLNERLARSAPDAAGRATVWSHYLRVWTRWNHVRTIASLLAAALFTFAAAS